MQCNVGEKDKLIRAVLALLVLLVGILYFTQYLWIAVIVAIILLLTSLVGFCPVYKVLGINTCEEKSKTAQEAKEKMIMGQVTKSKKSAEKEEKETKAKKTTKSKSKKKTKSSKTQSKTKKKTTKKKTKKSS